MDFALYSTAHQQTQQTHLLCTQHSWQPSVHNWQNIEYINNKKPRRDDIMWKLCDLWGNLRSEDHDRVGGAPLQHGWLGPGPQRRPPGGDARQVYIMISKCYKDFWLKSLSHFQNWKMKKMLHWIMFYDFKKWLKFLAKSLKSHWYFTKSCLKNHLRSEGAGVRPQRGFRHQPPPKKMLLKGNFKSFQASWDHFFSQELFLYD